MAVVPILPERGEVSPTLLDRPVRLEVRYEEVKKLLHV